MATYPLSMDAASPADMEPRRQKTIDRLTDAFASGTITMEEYERRAAAASAASLPAALEDLVLDLPVPRSAGLPSRATGRPGGPPPPRTGPRTATPISSAPPRWSPAASWATAAIPATG